MNTSVLPRRSVDGDFFAQEALADVYGHDGALREHAPFVWLEEHGAYFTGRQEIVQRILTDWRGWSSLSKPFAQGTSVVPEVLVTDDPPKHTRVRNALMQFMSPGALRKVQDEFDAVAEVHVEALLAQDIIDGAAVAANYVLKVFPDYLGLPEKGRELLLVFGEAVFNSVGPNNRRTQEAMVRAIPAFEWIAAHCSEQAVVPGKIASQIYALPAPGVVTIEEAQLLVQTLLAAGFDTTVLALSSAFYWLSRNPSQWPLLRDQAARKRAFEETIRIEPPARFLARVATGHMEIAGQSFEPGDHVVLSLTAAGRDPRRWSEPDQYDIERKPASHMSFGAGIHTCIGQALARMEFEALFSALARRFATIEPAGNAVRFENNAANGWKSVPIRFVPA